MKKASAAGTYLIIHKVQSQRSFFWLHEVLKPMLAQRSKRTRVDTDFTQTTVVLRGQVVFIDPSGAVIRVFHVDQQSVIVCCSQVRCSCDRLEGFIFY
jgi:hypothetical protein